MHPAAPSPLILTLGLDAASFERLDAMRRAHFPPERNLIPAHLTLFHKLPGEEKDGIMADLAAICRGEAVMPVTVEGPRPLGRGVALTVRAEPLARLRGRLAQAWSTWLTAQDRQRFQPHVTIQNKVTPDAARALHTELTAGFTPFTVTGEGLLLWRYLGGPWDLVGAFPFSGTPSGVT